MIEQTEDVEMDDVLTYALFRKLRPGSWRIAVIPKHRPTQVLMLRRQM